MYWNLRIPASALIPGRALVTHYFYQQRVNALKFTKFVSENSALLYDHLKIKIRC